MPQNKNILLSTTRQWNPGDEFILMGCINILKEVYGAFNPIIYNRNPEVRQPFNHRNPFRKAKYSNMLFKYKPLVDSFFRVGFLDNSFKDDTDGSFIDLAVFAGSPEWYGGRLTGMYKTIAEHNIPALYLGIGSDTAFDLEKIPALYRDILKKALFITVRDDLTYNNLKNLNPVRLPCPALLSVPAGKEKDIREVKKIGLIFGTDKAVINNRITKGTCRYLFSLYRELIKAFENKCEIEIVCHYIDELSDAHRTFNDLKINYSYDSRDYPEIYKQFDIVVGHRVHGIGLAASLGIPGILIAHDMRGVAGNGFLADIIDSGFKIEEVSAALMEKIRNIESYNRQLITYKHETLQKFIGLLLDRRFPL